MYLIWKILKCNRLFLSSLYKMQICESYSLCGFNKSIYRFWILRFYRRCNALYSYMVNLFNFLERSIP